MTTLSTPTPTVIHTERGLTIAGTRITLYDVMDYLVQDWPPTLIRDRLNLTDQQITDVIAYIAAHRDEVEADYQEVLQDAQAIQAYWTERNQERFRYTAASSPAPERAALYAKLRAWQDRIDNGE